MNETRKLIRTDRNGTEYYEVTEPCLKCGGTGYIGYYHYHDGGICYDCNGTGVHRYTDKVMTSKHRAELDARRKARQEKKEAKLRAEAEEQNKEFLGKNGFNEEGKAYVVLGNTYEVKEQLKDLGCKFNYLLGWYSSKKLEGFKTLEFDVSEVYGKDIYGRYDWTRLGEGETDNDLWESCKKKIEEANNEGKENNSEYVGEVGQKVEAIVKLKSSYSFDSYYGTSYIHTFEDEEGNVYVWKTSKDVEEGSYEIRGTVKEHSEYRGVKQTVLTRCRL